METSPRRSAAYGSRWCLTRPTPACAGNTYAPRASERTTWAYPRLRGEHLPAEPSRVALELIRASVRQRAWTFRSEMDETNLWAVKRTVPEWRLRELLCRRWHSPCMPKRKQFCNQPTIGGDPCRNPPGCTISHPTPAAHGSANATHARTAAIEAAAADEEPLHYGEFGGETYTADDLRRNASAMRAEADRCVDDVDWAEDLRGRAAWLDADADRLDSAAGTVGNMLPPPVDTMPVTSPDGEEVEIPYDVWQRFSELNDALGDGSADERNVFADRSMWRPDEFAVKVGGRLAALTDHGTDEFSDLHDWAYAACDVMNAVQASDRASEAVCRERRAAIGRLPWDQAKPVAEPGAYEACAVRQRGWSAQQCGCRACINYLARVERRSCASVG